MAPRARSMLLLPRTPEEIGVAWLSEALGRHVATATVERVILGAATKVVVRLSGDDVPPSVVVKAPLSGARQDADTLAFFAGEVAFYRDVAPRLDVGLPRALFAETRPEEGQALVVLEDLTGARFFTAGDTLDPGEAASVLDVLARLHATTWEGAGALARYPGPMRPVLTGMLSGRYWQGCLRRPRSRTIPPALREPDALLAAVERLWEADARGPECVVHGDAHVGNAYRDTNAHVGLLDGYLARLAAHDGPKLDRDTAWDAYRAHMVHGLFWATNADGMYPEDVNAEVVERFARAIAELG